MVCVVARAAAIARPRGASSHWPAASRVNSGRPANNANAICSATTRGAPGSWQTYSTSAIASAGPLSNSSTARRVSTVSVRRVDTPSMLTTERPPARRLRLTSRPRIVALERHGHAARAAAAAHQLRALERDHRPLSVANALLSREETDGRHHFESHLLQLAQRRLVAGVRDQDAGTRGDEVASARPLLALLDRAHLAAAEHRLHGQPNGLQRGEDVRHLAHVPLSFATMQNRQALGAHEVRRMNGRQLAIELRENHVEMNRRVLF